MSRNLYTLTPKAKGCYCLLKNFKIVSPKLKKIRSPKNAVVDKEYSAKKLFQHILLLFCKQEKKRKFFWSSFFKRNNLTQRKPFYVTWEQRSCGGGNHIIITISGKLD